jgi:hypothetical protein
MTAGGNITLTGNNQASTTNGSAAVDIRSGLQATAVGNIVIQAKTDNKNTDAIVFYSGVHNPTFGPLHGNVSLRSVDSNNVASGNILIQANQGRVILNNQLSSTYSATTVSDIIGKNITIDNTGGSYNSTTGAWVAGTGQSGSTLGGVMLSDTRTMTATGNITVVGQSEGSTGAHVTSTLTASAGTIDIRSNKNVLVQGALSANDVAVNSTGGDIVQSAHITGTQTVSLTATGAGKNITRTAGTLSGGLVRLEAANAIGGDDSGTTINRMQLATANLSLKRP